MARAAGFDAQRQAIGEMPTALVALANAVGEGKIDVMPEVLVTGGGSSIDGLAATLMRMFQPNGREPAPAPVPASDPTPGGALGEGDAGRAKPEPAKS